MGLVIQKCICDIGNCNGPYSDMSQEDWQKWIFVIHYTPEYSIIP